MRRITVTVSEEDWQYFHKQHLCISSFLQEKMHEIVPLTLQGVRLVS